ASVPLRYVFDNRDSRLNPTTGFRALAYAEPSYDILNGAAFVKLRGEGSAYQSLDAASKFVLAERVAIGSIIGVVPFVDVGTVSTNQFPDFSGMKVGTGVGLRYITPFGPLRIDAAVPLNRGPDDPHFGIYAGIGQAF
ncbi:MAG: outer membrane protein assembly factor, partial [Mesorhizobium sp.]